MFQGRAFSGVQTKRVFHTTIVMNSPPPRLFLAFSASKPLSVCESLLYGFGGRLLSEVSARILSLKVDCQR